MTTTGFLHPGAMGATIAAACSGERLWVSEGRSAATVQRAEAAGLTDAVSLAALVEQADMIVAVCPPESAEAVAAATAVAGFDGIYVDANAVSPRTTRRIGERFAHYVDGGIVGPPAIAAGTTRLYLAGADAVAVGDRFAGSVVEAPVLATEPGAASALKMAYAAWTKGTAALLLAIRAMAQAEGVESPLLAEWDRSQPELPDRLSATPSRVGPKAWRWVGEMGEIASTFDEAGLPTGFHEAAGEVYEALAPCRGDDDVTLEQVVDRLLDRSS